MLIKYGYIWLFAKYILVYLRNYNFDTHKTILYARQSFTAKRKWQEGNNPYKLLKSTKFFHYSVI